MEQVVNPPPLFSKKKWWGVKIIHEDKDVLVVDKPAGIVVHPPPLLKQKWWGVHPDIHHKSGSLVDFLLKHCPQIKGTGEDLSRPGIVHRLDKDTSGVLIAAKNNQAFQWLKEQFQQRKVIKKYLALVVGKPLRDKGTIKTYLGRGKNKIKQKVFFLPPVKGKTREAITGYKIIKKFKDYALLEVQPKTGRFHQIRTHLSWLGCPVAGDEKYKRKRQVCPKGLKRQFLHAISLKVKLPNGEVKEFKSPLPLELEKILNCLEKE